MKRRKKSVRRRFPKLLILLLAAAVAAVYFLLPQFTAGSAGFTVCLDAGHGGNDPGCATGERQESDDNLTLALAVQKELQRQGVQVLMTRTDDTYLTLEERCSKANAQGVDYFLSFHRNIADGSACGVEIWRSHSAGEESISLSENLLSALDSAGIQRNRGVHIGSQSSETQDYYVLRGTQMPCALLEMGFLDNTEDNHLFDSNQRAYARAIAQAVMETYAAFHPDT